jgi:predicted O-methyltransferase YrrM
MITQDEYFWKRFRSTPGALSCAEALAIMNLAELAPITGVGKDLGGEEVKHSLWLEMGTHKGKSALAAMAGVNKELYATFILLEPEFADDGWRQEVKNILRDGVDNYVYLRFLEDYSTDYLEKTTDKYAWVFSDAGSHQDGLPMREVKLLEDRIISGGIIAFHDFKSQFVEVEEAYDYLLSTGKYEEVPINWQEIVDYAEANNLEDGSNSSWHHTELKHPCFVGALRRKA